MVIEALVSVVAAFVSVFLGLFPDDDAPTWMADASTYFAQATSYVSGLGAWVPWSLAVTVLGSVIASMFLGFAIKVIRIIASFLTAGGGSAA